MPRFPPVHVVGGGACTSVGGTLAASAAAVRAGIAAFESHPYLVDSVSKPLVLASVAWLPMDVEGASRLSELAALAADEALGATLAFAGHLGPIPVIVGLPSPRPGVDANLEADFVRALRRRLPSSPQIGTIETIARGHAAGLLAIKAGVDRIRLGATDFCLVGGVDSYLHVDTLEWLEAGQQIHSAGRRNNAWGFIPGEASGFCLLASPKAAAAWKLERTATILTVEAALELSLIKTEAICLGRGLTSAFEQAFYSFQGIDLVEEIFCDMNGEPYRAEEYGFASMRTAERFVDASAFIAPADCWGDVGAASGPLHLNLACVAHRKRYSEAAHTLVWASSEGGERAAAIVSFERT